MKLCALFFAPLLCVVAAPALAQTNPALSRTLDSLAAADQRPMQAMMQGALADSTRNRLIAEEQANYVRHQPILEAMIRQHGFPGYAMVGEKSSDNFWLVVQHADAHPDFQQRVLALMLPEVKRHNASPKSYAYLTDRVALNTGKPQEYGTQVEYTGSGIGEPVPRTLRDPKNVNSRRAAIGLEPLEKYLALLSQLHQQMNTPAK